MNKRMLFLGLLVLTGCDQSQNVTAKAPEPADMSERLATYRVKVFSCIGNNLVLEARAESGTVYIDKVAHAVEGSQRGDATLYQGKDLRLQVKGKEAVLHRGMQNQACKLDSSATPWDAARIKGVGFRALGSEPGWVLEITNTELDLTSNYGQSHIQAKARLRQQGDKTLYQSADFTAILSPGPCTDSMSGERFETRVEIKMPDATLQGCGNSLPGGFSRPAKP
ncbi:COG3650 family protein [Gallaecimonas mangrovi]|uniref:COG3650 family protein n=1 Tax=Gallaecimonas mangrovi TaxID=2291597 RepID=UPI00126010F5|nr:hypothetical protein [Gallaecimonas mangrovi]